MADLRLVVAAITSTNKVVVNLYKASAPLVVIDTMQQVAPHPETVYSFFGLTPSVSYIFKVLEVDNTDTVLQQYFEQSFTVPAAGSIEYKAPVLLKAGTTTGFAAGVSTVTFNGGSAPDFRTWTPYFERVGQGTMKRNVDDAFNTVTGVWELLGVDGDGNTDQTAEGEYFFVTFEPKVTASAPATTTGLAWSARMVVTANTTLVVGDIGKKIIIKGASAYLTVTLPDIATVPEDVLTFIESGIGAHKNAAIASTLNNIDWLEGGRNKLYLGQSECLVIYKEDQGSGVYRWRVHDAEGYFKLVGAQISSYADTDEMVNAVEANGQILTSAYARLYNDHVLKQDAGNVCDYASWGTGNNKYKYSFADGSGNYHVPDLRDTFERVKDGTRKPGDFQDEATNITSGVKGVKVTNLNTVKGATDNINDVTGEEFDLLHVYEISPKAGTETRPKNYAVRKFILV